MKLLLDSHVWLWLCSTPERIPASVLEALQPPSELWLSVASIWEIAIKHATGKLPFPGGMGDILDEMRTAGAVEVMIQREHALRAAALPMRHRDPFDRMLVAQAEVEGMTLVTADELVRGYGGRVLWAGV